MIHAQLDLKHCSRSSYLGFLSYFIWTLPPKFKSRASQFSVCDRPVSNSDLYVDYEQTKYRVDCISI